MNDPDNIVQRLGWRGRPPSIRQTFLLKNLCNGQVLISFPWYHLNMNQGLIGSMRIRYKISAEISRKDVVRKFSEHQYSSTRRTAGTLVRGPLCESKPTRVFDMKLPRRPKRKCQSVLDTCHRYVRTTARMTDALQASGQVSKSHPAKDRSC